MCNDFHRDDDASAGETARRCNPLSDLTVLINATTLDARSARFSPQLAGGSHSGDAVAREVVTPVTATKAATTRMAGPKRDVHDRVCMTGQLRSEIGP